MSQLTPLHMLALQWILDHELVAPADVAAGLGVRGIENGFSVAFHRLEDLLAAMRRDADTTPARLRRRKYVNVALLIIDEVGSSR
jgi:DNA replication protein DnaC